jgi:hypothetical protein
VLIAARQHAASEAYVDVETFTPFGSVFLPADDCSARIASTSFLAVLPESAYARRPSSGIIELPDTSVATFNEMQMRSTKKKESIWVSLLKGKKHWSVLSSSGSPDNVYSIIIV